MRCTVRLASVLALLALAFTTGCGLVPSTSSVQSVRSGAVAGISGKVHGGQQPVVGSTIQLWQAGTSGYGTGAAPLGASTTTLADGSFSITGAYNCASAANGSNTLVYITATGGNPGLPGTVNNGALVLMAALGPCNSLTPSTFININEVTTVASTYALAQFISPSGNIGSPSFSTQGLANAFATVANLVNSSTGSALSLTNRGNGIVPQGELNSLANALAPCVNSANSSSAACQALFAVAPSSTSVAPVNVLTAALNIANNPAQNVSGVFTQSTSNAPFQPTLSVAPNDWTVALGFATGGSVPSSLAIESTGNVWIANYGSGGATSSVSMITPLGVPAANSPFFNSGSIFGAASLAINSSNFIWVANRDNSSAMEMNATFNGTNYSINTISGPFSGNGINAPVGIAIDGANNLWFSNSGNNTVLEMPGGNSNSNTTTYSGGGIASPRGIAIDVLGDAWVTNSSGGSIGKVNPNGVANPPASYTGGGITTPIGIAVDNSGTSWTTDMNLGEVARITASGTAQSPSGGFSGGGLTGSNANAIDGNGNLWVADTAGNRLSELNGLTGGPLSPTNGYQGGSLAAPVAMALDASGNIWLANQSPVTTSGLAITVSEFIGLASPVIAPLAQALQQQQLGQRPGTAVGVSIASFFLPLYSTSVAYNAKLLALGGNSGTFVWSQSAGALPTGLTLSTGGLVSGSTTQTGSFTFTAQACDTLNLTNCAAKSFTLGSPGTLALQGNESTLGGTYALRFSGFRNPTPGAAPGTVYGESAIGSLTFNGAGAITAGELDVINPSSSAVTSLTGVTGTYSVGSDNRGLISITQSGNQPIEFAISVGNFASGVGHTIHLIRFDDTQATFGAAGSSIGSGIAKLQTPGAFNIGTLGATFVFGFDGETPCTNYNNTNPSCPQTVANFGPISAAGYLTGSGGTLTGSEDGAAVGLSFNQQALTGTYSSPDSFGRGLMTLVLTASPSASSPTHFVYYIVNTGEMFLQSIDGHLNYALVNGDALLQTPGVFSAGNPNPLSGTYIGYESAPLNGNGLSFFPTQSIVSLYMITASGTQLTATDDQDKGGVVRLNRNNGTPAYSVDAKGRMTLTGAGGSPVFYLANTSQGFATEQPVLSTDNPGLFTLQQQTGGPFSTASVSGSYAYGVVRPPVLSSVNTGVFTSSSPGNGLSISDIEDTTGVLNRGHSTTSTIAVAANGRGIRTDTLGNTTVFYLISPGQAVSFSTVTNSTAPTLTYVQQ